MFSHAFQDKIVDIVKNLGEIGVFIGMFLESSILPIPSEVIIIGAGAMGLTIPAIAVWGSIGATLGAIFGYMLGRYAAMPIILKYGKFILIKPHHIQKAERFAKKYGIGFILAGRLLPVVPFKVFSITAGIVRIPIPAFVACVLIGVIPRILLLSVFGASIIKYTKPTIIIIACVILIFAAYQLSRRFYSGAAKKHK